MAELSDLERKKALDAFNATHSGAGQTLKAAASSPTVDATPTPGESAMRGAASGVLAGFQPQIWGGIKGALQPGNSMDAEIQHQKDLNDAAYNSNPLSYGAGYTGGAGALGLATGGLGDLALGARSGNAAIDAVQAARGIASKSLIPKVPMAGTVGTTTQGVGGVVGNQVNQTTPSVKDIPPPAGKENNITGTPISAADEKNPGAFSSLANYLAQAKDSNNSQVQAAAQAAQQSAIPGNSDSSRQVAMALQASPQGRAVGNSESPVNDTDEDEQA